MRNTLKYISVILATLSLAACQKDNTPEQKDFTQEPAEKHLVSATLVSAEQADEALQNVITATLNGIDSKLGTIAADVTSKTIFKGKYSGVDWQLKTYLITYMTKDARGEDIELSANVSFIDEASEFVKRHLSSVTLFHTMFNIDDNSKGEINTTKLMGDIVLPVRPFYNSLVVYPHYQGAGIDKGIHPITATESNLKARQAIDAELAALELLDTFDNVNMDEGYYTCNAGISTGGSVALALQKTLEGNPEYRDAASKIRLASTYVGEGCYNPYEVLTNLLDNVGGINSTMGSFGPYAAMGMIIGAYDTWTEEFSSRGIGSVNEFFSPAVLKLTMDYKGQKLNLPDYMNTGEMTFSVSNGSYDVFRDNGFTVRTMMNPNVFRPVTGELQNDCKFMQALKAAMSHNTGLGEGWTPVSTLKIVHSTDDEFMDFAQAEAAYKTLSSNGYNRNVKMETLKGTDHSRSMMVLLLRDIIGKENPCADR